MHTRSGLGFVVLTFFIALLLHAMPMPNHVLWARPEWLAMTLIYWVMAMPQRVGVGVAWLLGLVLDGIDGSLLGQHALALAVLAYITLILYQRIRMFVAWQQAFVVFVLIGLEQLLCHWTQSLQRGTSPNLLFLLPAVLSALLWPGYLVLLRGLRRRYGPVKNI